MDLTAKIAGCQESVTQLLHNTNSLFYTLRNLTLADELAMYVELCGEK